ncbi:hypothetical protein SARC_01620 [Sphaeroforma arctica JP610]|uniref:Uncharacterized protein n=1 Tax=Sphaeroforma arctica JP610 TaxID=667725 RepID=A0A0L0GB69_9EUKA|nr:hypothetical protein SARC_01620 [Sphaeroforma arctica JP610]KNC86245.1 hypothetical protein SARC_01620 [Sphaeroforma arctica JP610]|eukprot:XP_014160147.1 hypothetical protein SARC_01620 [Sphaeroforma arctica JP610]
MNTVIVTGANAGLGFETCRQLAGEAEVHKVILTCRSEAKGKDAVAQLVGLTKKPSTFFDVVVMDTTDIVSCKIAAEKVLNEYTVNGVVLNAGGNISGNDSKGNPLMHLANVIGHVVFTEELLDSGKIDQLTVVYSGSEAARGVSSLSMKPAKFDEPYKEDVYNHLSGKSKREFNGDSAYKYTKAIAALYIASLARKNPKHHIVTCSPGMTAGTNIMDNYVSSGVFKFFMLNVAVPLLGLFGMAHSVDSGASRYVDALFKRGNADVKSGTFLASKEGGLSGPVEDQSTFIPIFADTKLQDDAYDAVHDLIRTL